MTARLPGADAVPLTTNRISCLTCSLRRACLPGALAEADVARFDALVAHPPTLEPGVDVVQPGATQEHVFILRVGHLQEYVTINSTGRRRVTGYGMPSDMIGFDAFATGVHVTGARTLETVALCEIRRSDLINLAQELPELMSQLLQKMSQRLLSTQRLQLVVARHTARERVAAMLLSHMERAERIRWSGTHLRLPMAHGDIAASLGLSPEALSRTLRQMEEEGLISIERSEVKITDGDRLVEAADGPAEAIPPTNR